MGLVIAFILNKMEMKSLYYCVADGRAQELLLSQGEPVLLHADLHHYNILQHQDTWIAIDPKGVVGERGECGSL